MSESAVDSCFDHCDFKRDGIKMGVWLILPGFQRLDRNTEGFCEPSVTEAHGECRFKGREDPALSGNY